MTQPDTKTYTAYLAEHMAIYQRPVSHAYLKNQVLAALCNYQRCLDEEFAPLTVSEYQDYWNNNTFAIKGGKIEHRIE